MPFVSQLRARTNVYKFLWLFKLDLKRVFNVNKYIYVLCMYVCMYVYKYISMYLYVLFTRNTNVERR